MGFLGYCLSERWQLPHKIRWSESEESNSDSKTILPYFVTVFPELFFLEELYAALLVSHFNTSGYNITSCFKLSLFHCSDILLQGKHYMLKELISKCRFPLICNPTHQNIRISVKSHYPVLPSTFPEDMDISFSCNTGRPVCQHPKKYSVHHNGTFFY